MSSRPKISTTGLMSALALAVLGGATVFQLLSIESRFSGRDEAAPTSERSRDAGALVLSELRRIEGHGLLSASARSIALRVPTATGVVCATSSEATTIAVLPASSGPLTGTGSSMGWYDAAGDFTVTDADLRLHSTRDDVCARAAISPPAGSVVLAIQPAAAAARVGDAVVLFARVVYEFVAAPGSPGSATLWRTAGGTAEPLLTFLAADAAFRFYVDAAASPTATVPAPITRVRGIELDLPAMYTASSAARATMRPMAVFFRWTAG